MKDYDIIVIGAGPGGYVAAIKAAQLGLKVAIIEKEDFGGVCLNIGCIPTKALIKSAKVYNYLSHAEDYGLSLDKSSLKIDWDAIVKRKDGIVKKLTSGVKMLLNKNKVDIYQGSGFVKSATEVEVNNEVLKTKNVILATGASPVIPPIPGVKEAYESGVITTSKELLSLPKLPKSLVIVGGGVIGIEFATIFSTFGVDVTILEMAPNILLNVDSEVRTLYLRILKKAKINVLTDAKVTKVDSNNVTYVKDNKEVVVKGDKILMSVGMRANTKPLEHLNLETTKLGIKVNEYLETSTKGIYAIGDLNGQMMLAHTASAEGIVAVEHIMGKTSKIDYNKIPAGIYGFPEIAMVGLTEEQAIEQKLDYKAVKFPLTAIGKSLADGETDGFVKIIVDKKYGEILGMHIVATTATDMISEATMTMELEGTIFELAKTVHPHPSLSEAIQEAAHAAIDKPIHM